MSEHISIEGSSIVRICSEIILAFVQTHLPVDINRKISNDVLINNIFHHSHWNNFSLECFLKYLCSHFLKYFTLLFSPFVLCVCFCSSIYLFSNTDGPVLYHFVSSFLNVTCLTFDQKFLFLFYIIPAPVVALLEYIPSALNKKITTEIQCLQLKRVRSP